MALRRAGGGGAGLDAEQAGRVARRSDTVRAAERLEEALRDRAADGDTGAARALAGVGPAPAVA